MQLVGRPVRIRPLTIVPFSELLTAEKAVWGLGRMAIDISLYDLQDAGAMLAATFERGQRASHDILPDPETSD
jgi:hypothetical protein